MSRHRHGSGLGRALWRLGRLQSCGRCGHSWYPRGHWRSPRCPNCGTVFIETAQSSGSGARGCLTALAALAVSGFGILLIAALGAAYGVSAVVGLGAVIVAAVVMVGVLKQRAARARLASERRLELARADEQRLLAAAQEGESRRREAERYQGLAQRFGLDNANRIVAKTLWQGASADMIREMLGPPLDVSTRVFKTKKREVWKYNALDARRYGLRITLENEVCVGWETT
jgi:predicted RNA-binding Zn-ribbon protein involved in translation (DUF1610 family)